MRGYLYTLEVLVAIASVLVTVVLAFRFAPAKPEVENSIMKTFGYSALEYLDAGKLREWVYEQNVQAIKSNISQVLPNSLRFDVAICSPFCTEVDLPRDRSVVVVNKYFSGFNRTYGFRELKLYLWKRV